MRKILYTSVLLFILACKLDFPIEDEITGLDVIDEVAIANETLSGIYLEYPKNKLVFSKLADDFYPNHTIDDNPSDLYLYMWLANQIQYLANTYWSEYYSTISRANLLLSRVSDIKVIKSKDKFTLNDIEAQALCMKALCFYDLTMIFAETYSEETKDNLGIILKHNVNYEELPRSTLEESFQEIEKILINAISLFSDKEESSSYRFSKISAKALLSKLYFDWRKYQKSIQLIDEVIAIKKINEDSYQESWQEIQSHDKFKVLPEILLAMEGRYSYFSGIHDKESHDDEYYFNESISYENDDVRNKIIKITQDFMTLDRTLKEVDYLGKLRTDITDEKAKSIPIIRLAELHFIKTECLYHLSRESEAKETINSFLKKRKTSEINSSGLQFLKDVLNEKQKEFIGEGVRFFDMKRNKLKLKRVTARENKYMSTIVPTDYRWVFPLAKMEVKYNRNVVNNLGW